MAETLRLLQCRIRPYQFENLDEIADHSFDGNRSHALRQLLDIAFNQFQEEQRRLAEIRSAD